MGILHEKEPRPFLKFRDNESFLGCVENIISNLDIEEDDEKLSVFLGDVKEYFRIFKEGSCLEVLSLIKKRLIADEKFAVKELSPRATAKVHVVSCQEFAKCIGAQKKIRGIIVEAHLNVGIKGSGDIVFPQLVVRKKKDTYIWWSAAED